MDRAQAAPLSAHRPSERVADGCVHAVGLAGSVLAVAALLIAALPQSRMLLTLSVALYGAGLLAMWGCSALYNLAPPSARRELYRRMDHAAIFVMIAGTYSPFTLIAIGGAEGAAFFALVWVAAIGGAVAKLRCPHRIERLSILLYLLLGWSVLAAIRPAAAALPADGIALLAAGGLLYSVGIVFHLWDRLPYHNALWHGFVLAGAGCHFAAILGSVVQGGQS